MTTATLQHVEHEDYLAWALPSYSSIKAGRTSMADMRVAVTTKRPASDTMQLGSALHIAVLEPEMLPQRVAVFTGKQRRGAAWDEFKAEHSGKIILLESAYHRMCGMVQALRADRDTRQWCAMDGEIEVSTTGTIAGVQVKARCDKLTDDPLRDLKTTSNLEFLHQRIYDLGYHIQAFVYTTLFDRGKFILKFVLNDPPYTVHNFPITDEMIHFGWWETTRILTQWRQCCDTGVFPGPSAEPTPIPAWTQEQRVRISRGDSP